MHSTPPITPACPLCGGRVLYQGFTFVDCATPGCSNWHEVSSPAAAAPTGRQLMHFALALAIGQQWTEVSTGKVFDLTAIGSHSVDLDSCFGPNVGQWVKRTVSILDLADPAQWQVLSSPSLNTFPSGPFWPGSSRRSGTP